MPLPDSRGSVSGFGPSALLVLALALSIVPEVEGAEFSDERPDPQKLPHLAALEIALPELLAPEGELEADATRSWWIAGTAGAALAGSSELESARRHRKAVLARGHARQPLSHPDRVWQIGALKPIETRLGIEQVHL